MANITTRPAAVAVADADLLFVQQGGISKKITAANFRKLTGLQGVWDVTGVLANAVPATLAGTTVAPTANPEEFEGAFLTSAALVKVASSAQADLPVTECWAKFVVPASDGGDNDNGTGLFISNGEATDADIIATINGFPTLTGTVTFMGLFVHTAGASGFYAVGPGGIEGAVITGGVVAGDVFYFGVDAVNNTFMAQRNAGTPATIAHSFAGATLKVGLIGAFIANPPVLLDSPVLFSLGTTDAGKTPFQSLSDAAPPAWAGTLNGTRWLVLNTGAFNGKALADGDVAEFFNAATEVIVTPANVVTTANVGQAIGDYLAANPALSLLQEAILHARCYGVFNDDPLVYTLVRGDTMVVGPFPSGAFTTFAPYSVAVYDGLAWNGYSAAIFAGVRFFVIEETWPLNRTLTFMGVRDPDDRFQIGGIGCLLGAEHAPFSGGPTFAELVAAGWVVEYPNIAGHSVNTNLFPPPTINDTETVYVGGTETAWYIFSGDIGLSIASLAGISSGVGQEVACGTLILDLYNGGIARAVVSFTTTGGEVTRFLAEPGSTRRFLIVRKGGGSGDTSIVPLDNCAVRALAVPGSGWIHFGTGAGGNGFDAMNAERSGDQVRLSGVSEAQVGALSIVASLPVFCIPQTSQIFTTPFWDGAQWVFAICEAGTTGNITVLSPSVFPVGSRVHLSATFNRCGGPT